VRLDVRVGTTSLALTPNPADRANCSAVRARHSTQLRRAVQHTPTPAARAGHYVFARLRSQHNWLRS
jgi:hypothetical protein